MGRGTWLDKMRLIAQIFHFLWLTALAHIILACIIVDITNQYLYFPILHIIATCHNLWFPVWMSWLPSVSPFLRGTARRWLPWRVARQPGIRQGRGRRQSWNLPPKKFFLKRRVNSKEKITAKRWELQLAWVQGDIGEWKGSSSVFVLIIKLNWSQTRAFFLTNFRSASRGQRKGQILKASSDAREGGRNKRRERTRTPPVGFIFQLSWVSSLEGVFVSFPPAWEEELCKDFHPWSGFAPLYFLT